MRGEFSIFLGVDCAFLLVWYSDPCIHDASSIHPIQRQLAITFSVQVGPPRLRSLSASFSYLFIPYICVFNCSSPKKKKNLFEQFFSICIFFFDQEQLLRVATNPWLPPTFWTFQCKSYLCARIPFSPIIENFLL
jgi:hypothetical protein